MGLGGPPLDPSPHPSPCSPGRQSARSLRWATWMSVRVGSSAVSASTQGPRPPSSRASRHLGGGQRDPQVGLRWGNTPGYTHTPPTPPPGSPRRTHLTSSLPGSEAAWKPAALSRSPPPGWCQHRRCGQDRVTPPHTSPPHPLSPCLPPSTLPGHSQAPGAPQSGRRSA